MVQAHCIGLRLGPARVKHAHRVLYKTLSILKHIHTYLAQKAAVLGVHTPEIICAYLIGNKGYLLAVYIQHSPVVRQAEISLIIQGEVARPGVAYAGVGLDGEEAPSVIVYSKVQWHAGLVEAALGIVRVELAWNGGIAALTDIYKVFVLITHQAVHYLIEGLPGEGVHLKAGGCHICHIIGYNIQVLAVGYHSGS